MEETIQKFDEEASAWAKAGLIERIIKMKDVDLEENVLETSALDDGSTDTAADSSGDEEPVSKKQGKKRDAEGNLKEGNPIGRESSPSLKDVEETNLQEQFTQNELQCQDYECLRFSCQLCKEGSQSLFRTGSELRCQRR